MFVRDLQHFIQSRIEITTNDFFIPCKICFFIFFIVVNSNCKAPSKNNSELDKDTRNLLANSILFNWLLNPPKLSEDIEGCTQEIRQYSNADCIGADVISENSCNTGKLRKGELKFYKVNFTEQSDFSVSVDYGNNKYSPNVCSEFYKEDTNPTYKNRKDFLEFGEISKLCKDGYDKVSNKANSFRCISIKTNCSEDFSFRTTSAPAINFTSGVVTGTPSLPIWTKTSGAFTPINGRTIPVSNNNNIAPIPIGFSFSFAGITYTHLYISLNGGIGFDAGSFSTSIPTINQQKDYFLSPWRTYLKMDCSSTVSYSLESGSGKILTIQWLNVLYNLEYISIKPSRISFQVKLYETSNKIEFIYGPSDIQSTSGTASTGIRYYYAGTEGFVESLSGTNNLYTYYPSSFPTTGTIVRFTP
ncbi:MAG: hypothetical protein SFU98_04225 [Leptospiraceae bacterium]|nr:hypothetical protein [Leptospiraceae bacterium]